MTVWVYGATGFTGRLVCEALRARRVAFGVAGRDRARVEALGAELGVEARAAELHHTEALYAALGDATVVVSCAGPFARFGEPVLRAALRARAHYVDTTGEQAFMRDVYERYESDARRAGVCVVNALAFEVALGDWAAALAAAALPGAAPLDEVAIGYAIDGMRPTQGTQRSALAQLGARGVVWERDRWDPVAPAAERRTFGFPPPLGDRAAVSFPSGEVITVPRHVAAHRVQAFLALPPGPLGALAGRAGPLLGPLARSPLGAWARRRVDRALPPTPGQRRVNDFAVAATARRGFASAHVCVTGVDVYGITAEIVALGAQRMLSPGPRAAGVRAPAEALDALACLRALPVAVTASFPLEHVP